MRWVMEYDLLGELASKLSALNALIDDTIEPLWKKEEAQTKPPTAF